MTTKQIETIFQREHADRTVRKLSVPNEPSRGAMFVAALLCFGLAASCATYFLMGSPL